MILISYDVVSDKRRSRLHEFLHDYGRPVQYSVFECDIDVKMLKQIRPRIRRIIHRAEDSVRYYIICERCGKETIAVEEPTEPDGTLIV